MGRGAGYHQPPLFRRSRSRSSVAPRLGLALAGGEEGGEGVELGLHSRVLEGSGARLGARNLCSDRVLGWVLAFLCSGVLLGLGASFWVLSLGAQLGARVFELGAGAGCSEWVLGPGADILAARVLSCFARTGCSAFKLG